MDEMSYLGSCFDVRRSSLKPSKVKIEPVFCCMLGHLNYFQLATLINLPDDIMFDNLLRMIRTTRSTEHAQNLILW